MDDITKGFDLANFQKASQDMIATNDDAYKGRWDRFKRTPTRDYTPEEIYRIINSGVLKE